MTTESDVEQLLAATARLNRWVNRHADLGLPSAQLRTLALVGDLAPARVGDLAAADGITQPTMTSALARLEGSGYVARTADAADARASLVDLTAAGRRALATARARRTGILTGALDGLPRGAATDTAAAAAALGRLVDALGIP